MTTTLNQIETELATLKAEATKAIASADTLEQLEQLRVNYLGKKGQLSVVLRGMGKLTAEDRPRIGAIANDVKELLQDT
jgi:phenylalanyl-tRNA synthetase alpha chain